MSQRGRGGGRDGRGLPQGLGPRPPSVPRASSRPPTPRASSRPTTPMGQGGLARGTPPPRPQIPSRPTTPSNRGWSAGSTPSPRPHMAAQVPRPSPPMPLGGRGRGMSSFASRTSSPLPSRPSSSASNGLPSALPRAPSRNTPSPFGSFGQTRPAGQARQSSASRRPPWQPPGIPPVRSAANPRPQAPSAQSFQTLQWPGDGQTKMTGYPQYTGSTIGKQFGYVPQNTLQTAAARSGQNVFSLNPMYGTIWGHFPSTAAAAYSGGATASGQQQQSYEQHYQQTYQQPCQQPYQQPYARLPQQSFQQPGPEGMPAGYQPYEPNQELPGQQVQPPPVQLPPDFPTLDLPDDLYNGATNHWDIQAWWYVLGQFGQATDSGQGPAYPSGTESEGDYFARARANGIRGSIMNWQYELQRRTNERDRMVQEYQSGQMQY